MSGTQPERTTAVDLTSLFEPASVAVVGASQNPAKLGHVLLKNVVDYGFGGDIYPVNPAGGEILGLQAYRSVSEIPRRVDLVLVSVPNRAVLDAARDAASARARSMVVLSSGFGETGSGGKGVEAEILGLARDAGMRIVGPNCMGVYNLAHRCNATYFWELPRVDGNVSFVSQSGAFGGLFFNEIRSRAMGIAKFVSIGNMIDLDQADFLSYLENDPRTEVICMFIEGIRDGRKFMEVASRVARKKPVVALKAGRTEAGTRAASSHTGSLAGSAEIYDAAFRQAGILVARSSEEFFDVSFALSAYPRTVPATARVAVMTISGGPSVIASDACEQQGLQVPRLADATIERVRSYIPEFGAYLNPVDMTPQMDPPNYVPCVDAVAADPDIAGLIAINVGLDVPEFGQAFAAARANHDKPITSFLVDNPGVAAPMKAANIPNFVAPERAVAAYAGLVRRASILRDLEELEREHGEGGIPTVAASTRVTAGPAVLDEHQAKLVLAEYGLPVSREELVSSFEDAERAARALHYPVVLKLCSAQIMHKSDVGAVELGIKNEAELEGAYGRLAAKFGGNQQFLVQEQVRGTAEVIIGAKWDPSFGHVVLFGIGGVWAELLHDVALRLAPLSLTEARAMMREVRGYKLLSGFRGSPPVDVEGLAKIIHGVSLLVSANPHITELDLNPVIVGKEGARIVDALLVTGG